MSLVFPKDIKVGVKYSEKPNNYFLESFTPPPSNFVATVCEFFNVPDPNNYTLAVEQTPVNEPVAYINESDWQETIENSDSVLVLIKSPSCELDTIIKQLNKENSLQDWNNALRYFLKNSKCVDFVSKFIELHGHERLLHLLASGQCSAQKTTLNYIAGLHHNILNSVRLLFLKYGLPGSEHGLISWSLINKEVLEKLVMGLRFGEVTLQTLECCYDLLEHCIRRLPDKAQLIVSKIDSEGLFARLKNEMSGSRQPDKRLQESLVTFLNTIFRYAKENGNETEKVCTLLSADNRDTLIKCIGTLRGSDDTISPSMLRQLVELQQHLLCLCAAKCIKALSSTDQKLMSYLHEMRSLVEKGDINTRLQSSKCGPEEIKQFTRLGFEFPDEPYRDFDVSRGGMLSFECVRYFVNYHGKEAHELVKKEGDEEKEEPVDNPERFPFIRASGILTNLLAKKFKLIGDMDHQYDPVAKTDFFPLLFNCESPFEKVFSKCITSFARTWRDMRATTRDIETVRKVVSEQLTQTFSSKECRERLVALDDGLQKNNYAEIIRLQKQREEEKRKNKELSEEIRRCVRPRVCEIISENRIRHMQIWNKFQLADLTFFSTKTKVAGNTFVHLRLSPNQKDLYYEIVEGSFKGEKTPKGVKWSGEELDDKKKISLANITAIKYGHNCPHASKKNWFATMRAASKLGVSQSIVSLNNEASATISITHSGIEDQIKRCMTLQVQTPDDKDENGGSKTSDINLIAMDIDTLDVWKDGLSVLKNMEDRSSLHDRDFERLVDLEIKVRSLHVQPNHDITRKPPIPPAPSSLPEPLIRT